jgi:carboxyl-terminal processing protease
MKRAIHPGIAGLLLAALAAAARPAPEATDAVSDSARLVARYLPRMHMTHRPFDDAVAGEALDLFLDALDFEHSYFLAGDVERFRREAGDLDDRVAGGDVRFAFEVYDTLQARVSNRVTRVKELLDEGFDLGRDEEYEWKRKNAPWPADQAEWDELWRKRIKNQYVARLVAEQLDTESPVETDAAGDGRETASGEADRKLPPREFILKGYERYLTLLTDSDAEWVLERYLTAFTRVYDPHTDYLSASNTEDFNIGMSLSLFGIGALLSSEDGAAKVERLITGGPADRDGRLQPGDKIIAVAQGDQEAVDILHWPLSKAVRLIRGEKGTRVVLTVLPASAPAGSTSERIDLVRDEVKLEEQAAKGDVREVPDETGHALRVGVITLPEFYADVNGQPKPGATPRSSTRDVAAILNGFATNPVDGVVLDLRGNGGGLLAEAVAMTGLFIDSGPVVKVSNGRAFQVLNDVDPDTAYAGPLVVLVNRQTASASEILAGALQDYGRAIIVGDSKTHGKGTVQSLTGLRANEPAAGSLKVTTACFYRIGGRSTQRTGVTPDIVTPSMLDALEIGEEFLPHALAATETEPALYRPSHALDGVAPELRRRSEDRMRKDDRYRAFRDLLAEFGARQKEHRVSLRLEDRLDLARRERALGKLIENAQYEPKAGTSDPASAAKTDLILTEALNVMGDLITLEKDARAAEARRGAVVAETH